MWWKYAFRAINESKKKNFLLTPSYVLKRRKLREKYIESYLAFVASGEKGEELGELEKELTFDVWTMAKP